MRSAIIAITAIVGALLVACQDSDVSRVVGARCDRSTECDERCLGPDVDYPGGLCSLACNSRGECPEHTTCADRDGGVCLFECEADRDCAFLGTGWACHDADLRGGGIKVMVCRG
jgi:hypothetical protein